MMKESVVDTILILQEPVCRINFYYLLLANPAKLHISINTKYSSTLLQLAPQKLPRFW